MGASSRQAPVSRIKEGHHETRGNVGSTTASKGTSGGRGGGGGWEGAASV